MLNSLKVIKKLTKFVEGRINSFIKKSADDRAMHAQTIENAERAIDKIDSEMQYAHRLLFKIKF